MKNVLFNQKKKNYVYEIKYTQWKMENILFNQKKSIMKYRALCGK
jgi:hypothetical protein